MSWAHADGHLPPQEGRLPRRLGPSAAGAREAAAGEAAARQGAQGRSAPLTLLLTYFCGKIVDCCFIMQMLILSGFWFRSREEVNYLL